MAWDPPFSSAVIYCAAGAAVAVLLLAWRWALQPSGRGLKFFVPRLMSWGLAGVILANPVTEQSRELPPQPARVTALVDCSRSMGLDHPETRLESARNALHINESLLDPAHGADLQLFTFGEQLSSATTVAQMRAHEEASQLAMALERLPSLYPRELPRAVVVFSDGTLPEASRLSRIASDYSRLEVPIHVFPLGSQAIRGDVAIEDFVIPAKVTPGDRVPVRATIRTRGYSGERAVLRVKSRDYPQREPLATLPLTLEEGSRPYEVVVEADANAGGLLLEVSPLPNEAIEGNNRVPFELLAPPRKIRVLYMEGTQGSEYRYIQDALHEDPHMECLSMVVNSQYARRPRLQRVGDPYRGFPETREDLFEFDVVICSDISQGAFTREQLEWTRELVADRGGGFAMVGGHTSFGAGRWDQTAWDQIIPIDIRGGRIGQGYVNQTFSVEIPAKARRHPIWRIVDDPRRNGQILDQMPPFHGTNLAERVKPGATLLGVSAQSLAVAGITPIFACESYGRGRTFAMLPDSTIAWGTDFERRWGEGDNRYFRKFWRNVVHWLARNSTGGGERIHVHTNKQIYRPDEAIQLAVEIDNDQMQRTTDYRVEVELPAGPAQVPPAARLAPSEAEMEYRGRIPAYVPTTGNEGEASTLASLPLEIVAYEGSREAARRTAIVQILHDSRELQDPLPRPEVLQKIAQESGGQILTHPADLADLLNALPTSPGERVVHRSPRWDTPWLWGAIMGLFAIEWALRRRYAAGGPR